MYEMDYRLPALDHDSWPPLAVQQRARGQ